MYQIAKKIYKTLKNLLLSPFIISDYLKFKEAVKTPRFPTKFSDFFPQIFDKTKLTDFDRHYVYHTAWAARVVKEINPDVHVDIASSLYFPGIVSAFIPVDFYDYRPAKLALSNLNTAHADLTNLHFESNSIKSLSCLHTIEHIGLGRYGDPIDPDGDIKACSELSRVLAEGGSLIFVTPVGGEAKIMFNAHRIYTHEQVLALFPELTLTEFSLIPEYAIDGELTRNADKAALAKEKYACGCFVFKKINV